MIVVLVTDNCSQARPGHVERDGAVPQRPPGEGGHQPQHVAAGRAGDRLQQEGIRGGLSCARVPQKEAGSEQHY